MGTTSKMLIPYPEATGLVKDGWEDMKDIATQVDAKSGLVLLNTTSFSAVASQSINDVFSASYDNYFIVVNHTGTANASLELRLRVSGADNTTANYDSIQLVGSGGTASSATTSSATSWVRWGVNTWAGRAVTCSYIFDPFNAVRTTFQSSLNGYYSPSLENKLSSGSFNGTTSFTGFTIINGSGNITGSVKVYGINQ